jgi:hypothetical protein
LACIAQLGTVRQSLIRFPCPEHPGREKYYRPNIPTHRTYVLCVLAEIQILRTRLQRHMCHICAAACSTVLLPVQQPMCFLPQVPGRSHHSCCNAVS